MPWTRILGRRRLRYCCSRVSPKILTDFTRSCTISQYCCSRVSPKILKDFTRSWTILQYRCSRVSPQILQEHVEHCHRSEWVHRFLKILQEVKDLHRTDYLIAQAMGYTGTQIPDSDGVEIASNFVEYSYLDGRWLQISFTWLQYYKYHLKTNCISSTSTLGWSTTRTWEAPTAAPLATRTPSRF